MQLVEIDPIDIQSAKAGLRGSLHIFWPRAAFEVVVDAQSELRRDDRIAATGAEGAAEKALAVAAAVHVGRVEKVDAGIERGMDDLRALTFVNGHAEVVAADADD